MNFNSVKLVMSNVGMQVKKHGPEIMIAVGVVGGVTSGVLACKATLKAKDIIDESKKDRQLIEDLHDGKIEVDAKYTDEDYKKDVVVHTTQTAIQVAKVYAPAISIGIVSIASILGGYNVMRKRNVAIAAAYSAVSEGFRTYRNRVIDKYGKEVDRELKYGYKSEKVEVQEVNEETGEIKNVKKKVNVITADNLSEYAKMFTNESHCWENNFEYNMMFLRAQQQYANDILIARGHLFLNEVYEMLGIPHTKAGQLVGWVYNPNNPDVDNYVDFNLPSNDDVFMEHIAADGEKKYDRCIPLDFNVDGYVLDLI